MGHPPLSETMRLRVIVGGVAIGLLVLLMLPLEVLVVARGRSAGAIAFAFGLGVGMPAVFAVLLWWSVRRWRRDPELRRQQPNKAAARISIFGTVGVVFLGNVARDASGATGWAGFGITMAVVVVGGVIVFLLAKRQDPRLHLFRRPDPVPEGQEPDPVRDRPRTSW